MGATNGSMRRFASNHQLCLESMSGVCASEREQVSRSLKWVATIVCVEVLALSIATIMTQSISANQSAIFEAEKAGFVVRFKNEITPYRVTAVFVLPEEELVLEALDTKIDRKCVLLATEGTATRIADNSWHWEAPTQAGLYPIRITDLYSGDTICLNVFVMVPYTRIEGDCLNGCQIGKYPASPLKQLPIYKPPKGFVEITEENEETLLAPHFKLKQFVCKQNGGYPKYAVLRERLLLKLELILEKVNEEGYRCDTFEIMSGYRTPCYNDAIGNGKYSRHLWGGAADIFIDENPKDYMMDDLNGDGKNDYHDAAVLHDIIDRLYGKPFYEVFLGGLSKYKKTASHGPFVHVDVRGFRARWGK
jgi:hypothetical protein